MKGGESWFVNVLNVLNVASRAGRNSGPVTKMVT